MTRALFALFTLALAGCLGSGSGPDSKEPGPTLDPPHTFTAASIDSGTWILARPQLEDGQATSVLVTRNVTYGAVGIRDSDSFHCATLAVFDGWIDGFIGHQRATASAFSGTRQGSTESWTGVQYADEATRPSYSLLAKFNNSAEAAFLVANEAYGSEVRSEARLESEDPFTIESGPYWCLASPVRLSGGSYRATTRLLDAQNLAWSQHMGTGILVRVESNFPDIGVNLENSGQSHPLPAQLKTNGTVDATFCSRSEGTWSIHVPELRSELTSPWVFAFHIFDIDLSQLPCNEAWEESRFANENLFADDLRTVSAPG